MNQIADEVMNDTDYKELIIDIDQKLDIRDESILKNLFAKFPEEEFTCDISENNLTVFLNSLDLEFLKKTINIIKSGHLTNGMSNILDSIVANIESIKSYGLKGHKRIYIGYNKERKVQNRKAKEINRNQYYYANNNNFSTINNIIPSDFENKIICGDSVDVLKKLPDNCIDLVFTSPPYNFGLEYESNEDAHHWERYFDKLFRIFDECIRVLKFGGRIIVNTQPLFSDYIPSHHVISNYFMSKKLIWKGEILWEKNNYNCKYTAWGSWKSPSNPYLKYTWEFLEIFCKGTLKKDGSTKDSDIAADEFKNWVVARWSIAPERNMKEFSHPAMFPEELVYRVLKLFSFKNDIVLDPFNGVGTTTFVAKRLERKYVGIDISEEYCLKSRKRLNSVMF